LNHCWKRYFCPPSNNVACDAKENYKEAKVNDAGINQGEV
jgi:hypothetical protein